MEIRVALAACLVLGSALCGRAMAEAVRRRAKLLSGVVEGVRTLKLHMTSLFEPVRNALEGCDCPILSMVAGEMEDGASAHQAWERVKGRAARRGGVIDALDAEDREILSGLFERLGQSGREEQEALLSGALDALERRREEAAAKARQADRLYLSLGFLIGIMLALVVI